MGLLDDAIREHLELKRAHGAPDDEIERAEQEALAPARRDPAAGAGVPPLEEIPGDELPAGDHEPPPPPPPVDDPVFADEYATEPAPADFDEPPLEPEPQEPRVTSLQPVADEPELEDLEEREELEELEELEEEPVEPDRASTSILDDPLAEGPPPADEPQEDVLEETPEFLQDTPEHDKLWFEQKPPRDFDFE